MSDPVHRHGPLLVGQVGVEPTIFTAFETAAYANSATGLHSLLLLHRMIRRHAHLGTLRRCRTPHLREAKLVPKVGVEPTRLSALVSKTSVAAVTPLGHIKLVKVVGIEPTLPGSKPGMPPLHHT